MVVCGKWSANFVRKLSKLLLLLKWVRTCLLGGGSNIEVCNSSPKEQWFILRIVLTKLTKIGHWNHFLEEFNVKERINTTNFKNCLGINSQRQGVDKMVENKFYNVEFHSMLQDLF
jgi:hypothetical protein